MREGIFLLWRVPLFGRKKRFLRHHPRKKKNEYQDKGNEVLEGRANFCVKGNCHGGKTY